MSKRMICVPHGWQDDPCPYCENDRLRDVLDTVKAGDEVSVPPISPDAMRELADIADALAAPRNQSRFWPQERVVITTPNGKPYGVLVWNAQQGTYMFWGYKNAP